GCHYGSRREARDRRRRKEAAIEVQQVVRLTAPGVAEGGGVLPPSAHLRGLGRSPVNPLDGFADSGIVRGIDRDSAARLFDQCPPYREIRTDDGNAGRHVLEELRQLLLAVVRRGGEECEAGGPASCRVRLEDPLVWHLLARPRDV